MVVIKDRPKIERWVPSEGMDSIVAFPSLAHTTDTYYVLHSDHLAAIADYEARIAEDAKVRAQLVEALKKTSNVLIHHRIDGHTNPLCGWDFAATLANIDAALAAAKERG